MTNLMASSIPVALTIAGSDSGGGAGIQADLRTFAFHCVHGTSALTCITAQNTLGVNRVDALLPEAVKAQIEAVVKDIGVHATKTGMLLNQEIILAVAEAVEALSLKQLVVDPVMVSRAGVQLIDDSAVAALRDFLLPKASIVTPNIYEAEIFTGLDINDINDMRLAAEKIHKLGVKTVLVKGGALKSNLRGADVWFDGECFEILRTTIVETTNTHGTGCTLSAAIAANLAQGQDLFSAVKLAKDYVTNALKYALEVGQGQGPVGHFFPLLLDISRKEGTLNWEHLTHP
ncbi:MAG: bifunctional hydroxymethylpyrimidine kinase/phosphomethylpyrimidine kinase [Okeania sp. SIO3I5]|uniref:bifunctional hydroxymethylpyrimidine kinase/phosphomethylpyrimidine kinase n=1 Tax=Okeania sp. SIO3I5 TaxID=2607805 RepID=UPI0013BD2CC7|nr:bifunctional hydroxymethylpyrimidine kinase/phosphomethylpyrimidine kinase [Okeania sp. SIO3I5]NEQ35214.1 bifunctional hydroxymethylpyrimidine kinase/phosphomethylpyrimidine kinase [Okeania sp. SIO3I5]